MIDAWLRLSARSQALWLFGASALIALAGLLFFEGAVVDGTGRTLLAARWVMAPYNIIGTEIWGTGNYVLPALAIALGGDLFYSVRVLYALIGAATIPVLFFLAREVRGREAAVWAGVLFALNPYRLANSLEGATAEVPFVFLVFLGLLLAARQRARVSHVEALLAGLCFTAAASFRYEAGFWALLSGLLILSPLEPTFRPRLEWSRVKSALVFCLAASSYPVVLVVRWWRLHGDPLYSLHATATDMGQFVVDGRNVNWPSSIYIPLTASFWFLSVAAVLTPFVAAAAFLGIVRVLRDTRAGPFAMAILAWLSLLTLASVTRNFLLEYRYALPAYGLACMFVPDGIAWLGSRFAMLARPRVHVTLIGLSLILFYAAYSLVAFHDFGVLGRRLGNLSPVRPGQYETRTFIAWLEQSMKDKTLLMSPCVASPYLILGRHDLIESGRVRPFSTYERGSIVYDRRGYEAAFAGAAADRDLVVFRRPCRGLSLTDGRIDDPFSPPEGVSQWAHGSLTMRHVRDFGSLAVFTVDRDAGETHRGPP
jgi:4-amino-4-deoxy-L-arabinose transferase-like glycosyltransferase